MRISAVAAALLCAPLFVSHAQAQNDAVTSASTRSGAAATSRGAASSKDSNTTGMKPTAPAVKKRAAASPRPARRAAQPTGLALECLKKAGASPDPVTGRWIMYVTERDGMSRADMYRLCLAGGDRQKAKSIVLQEYQLTPATPTVPAR